MNLEELRIKYKDDILRIAEKYGVTSIRVFGSVARGDAREDSDVDFLVRFSPKTSFIELNAINRHIEELINKPVHLISENGVNPLIRDAILKDSIIL